MRMRIKNFAKLTGVSVRTLHYYDEIGLLPPAFVDKSTGYRYYDERSILRMQEILFYRELDFSLKSIGEILTSPDYDRSKALEDQKILLLLRKERLERLISAIDKAMQGESVMCAFDNSEFEKYKTEAKAKWGTTQTYGEFTRKTAGYSEDRFNTLTEGLSKIFAEFAACMKDGNSVCSAAAQSLVKKLQAYITENYYTCTEPILMGLGQMYVADERFRDNIDRHGAGTAHFASAAIGHYTKR